MPSVARSLLALSLLLPAFSISHALAADSEDRDQNEKPKVRWYQVDLVIFLHKSRFDALKNENLFVEPSLLSKFDPDLLINESQHLDSGLITYRMTPDADKRLLEEQGKLKRSGNPILSHLSWQQTFVEGESNTIGITETFNKITKLKPTEDSEEVPEPIVEQFEVAGQIDLSLDHYLEANLDIRLSDMETLETTQVSSHIKTPSKKLHYIDHPYFGVLLEFYPIEQPVYHYIEAEQPVYDQEYIRELSPSTVAPKNLAPMPIPQEGSDVGDTSQEQETEVIDTDGWHDDPAATDQE